MKIPTVLAQAEVPGTIPYGRGDASVMNDSAQAIAHAGRALQEFSGHIARIGAEQRKADAALDLDSTIAQLKQDHAVAQQDTRDDTTVPPERYADTVMKNFDTMAGQYGGGLKYPESRAAWGRKVADLRAETFIRAHKEGVTRRNDQLQAAAEIQNVQDANTAVFGVTPGDRQEAFDRALMRTQKFIQQGIYTGEKGGAVIKGFLEHVEKGQVLRDGNDPNQLPRVIQDIIGGQKYKNLQPDAALGLVESILNRSDKLSSLQERQFNLDSGELRKVYQEDIRKGTTNQDFASFEARIFVDRDRFSKADFTEILAYNDSLRKARTQGVSDETVLTRVTQAVDTRQIKTIAQLNQFAGALSQPDIRTLSDKITSLGETDRKEAKSDDERRADKARSSGEKFIRDATTISSNLLNFDQVAKQIEADQAFRFNTETNGLTDVGKINEAARLRVTEARAALAEKLSFEGKKLYPLLGQYTTREAIQQGYQQGAFGPPGSAEARTKSDNMIHLVDFLTRLTGQTDTRALEQLTQGASEASGKAQKSNLIGRGMDKLRGVTPTPQASPQDMEGPVRESAAELFPDVPLGDLTRDEKKIDAVTKRALERLKESQGKKK